MRQDLQPFVFAHLPGHEKWSGPPAPTQREVAGPRRRGPAAATCAVRETLDRFGQDRSDLTPAHVARLRDIARCVRDSQRSTRPIRSIRVVGHASAEGSDAYNLALGTRRATQVRDRLRAELDAAQPGLSGRVTLLPPESRGERELTGRGREADRRVDIHLPRSVAPRPRPRPPQRGCAPQRERIRLHLKIISPPTLPISTMLRAMRQIYHPAGFRVEVASRETIRAPTLEDLDIHCPGSAGSCPCAGGAMSAEHTALFAHRNNVRANDIVVYFVKTIDPAFLGCAAHPPGRPGAVLAANATEFVLAHEVGHVLGLSHATGLSDRLMFPNDGFTNPPPDLIASEVATMTASALTVPC